MKLRGQLNQQSSATAAKPAAGKLTGGKLAGKFSKFESATATSSTESVQTRTATVTRTSSVKSKFSASSTAADLGQPSFENIRDRVAQITDATPSKRDSLEKDEAAEKLETSKSTTTVETSLQASTVTDTNTTTKDALLTKLEDTRGLHLKCETSIEATAEAQETTTITATVASSGSKSTDIFAEVKSDAASLFGGTNTVEVPKTPDRPLTLKERRALAAQK